VPAGDPGSRQSCTTTAAVVHRPQYDDWTLKGKSISEDDCGAVREVEEETGHVGVIEHDLGRSATTSPI
jgi:hypothetical protein